MRISTAARSAAMLAVVLSATWLPAPARAAVVLEAHSEEPRAFGYQVGDTLERRIVLTVPDGLRFDADSLPRPAARGLPVELRRIARRDAAVDGGTRIELTLGYQVFVAPPQARTYEIAPMLLRVDGGPRPQELRIDAWPVTVAPLVPEDVSPRRGLGELQPDAAPLHVADGGARRRLVMFATTAALLAAWLFALRVGVPWWQRRHTPFGRAWQDLRGLPAAPDDARWQAACRRLHAALNESAGEVLYEHRLAAFVAARPAFVPLRDDLAAFLRASRQAFFAPHAPAGAHDGAALRTLCRRCRDAEGGRL